jgi:hypothetical protein
MPKRRLKPRPTMDLRRQTQRETIARLLLLGWTAERIARRMGYTPRAIRYHIATPEFESLYTKLQREHLQRVDRKLGSLLNGAVDALERLLKHSDWRARNAALEHVFRINSKYVERYDISGTLDHRHQVRPVQGELVDDAMTDEMRVKARELLQLQRQMFAKHLPARFAQPQEDDPLSRDHGLNGRFLPKEHDPEREG